MSATIVEFPKDAIVRDPSELNKNEVLEALKEKGITKFADVLTSELIAELACSLEDSGLDIESEEFIKSMDILTTVLAGTVYRLLGLPHPAQEFIDGVKIKYVNDDDEEPVGSPS
jgi:hypothetical protein